MQMIIELHDKEAQAEKERNSEFMKRFELEVIYPENNPIIIQKQN
jgi:hypothetical protein